MSLSLFAIPALALVVQIGVPRRSGTFDLCPHITIVSARPISFLRTERQFLCGDENSEAWRRKPLSQLAFHARSMLQTKGFHSPTFDQQGDRTVIDVGPMTLTRSVQIHNLPEGLSIPRYRRPIGRPMTPQLLDQTSQWLRTELGRRGFPCVEVDELADPKTGVIDLTVRSLSPRPVVIRKVYEPQLTNILPHVFERYRAFHLESVYDERKLEITNRRIDNDGVAEASHFRALCEGLSDDGVDLEHTVLTGAPRVLRVGFGISTDEYLLGRVNWRVARLGSQASTLWFDVRGSFREQSFRSYALWYVSDKAPRLYLHPTLSVLRESEDPYIAVHSSAQVLTASSRDLDSMSLLWKLGPKFTDSRIFEGIGPKDVQFVSLIGAVEFASHNFEYFRFAPRDGWAAGVQAQGLHESLYAPLTALKTSASFDFLASLGDQDPKTLIFGFRGRVDSSLMADRLAADRIPLELRRYLGGSRDLRGFSRRSLPAGGAGAISAAFASFELRTERFLGDGFHPLVLFDLGALGRDKFRFAAPLFASVGGGLRWASPIGVLRTTIARGLVWGAQPGPSRIKEDIQFHASLGEEF